LRAQSALRLVPTIDSFPASQDRVKGVLYRRRTLAARADGTQSRADLVACAGRIVGVMCRALALPVCFAIFVSGCGGGAKHVVSANGARLTVPRGWQRVEPAAAGVTDPRTLLVVGTSGARARKSRCDQASYAVPASGAVVVVLGWSSVSAAGGAPEPGRAPLERLASVRRPSFECFSGRGAAADLLLAGKRYQVGVLVGDRATKTRVQDALAVARSFEPG